MLGPPRMTWSGSVTSGCCWGPLPLLWSLLLSCCCAEGAEWAASTRLLRGQWRMELSL